MKKLGFSTLALLFCLGLALPAAALEINVSGDFCFAYLWQNNAYNNFSAEQGESFMARQRVRLTTEFVASEELKGVVQLHSSSMWWGDKASGAALDTTSNSFYVRQLYIDWNWPGQQNLNLKLGLQNVALPGAVAGSPVLNDTAAGVTVSYEFSEQASASLGWYRLSDQENQVHDKVDMFALLLPVSGEYFSFTPWGELTLIGENATLGDNKSADKFLNGSEFSGNAYMWHLGLAAELAVTDALTLKADAIYGAVNARRNDLETRGYFFDLKAEYNMGLGSLALAAWYSSGNNGDYDGENTGGRGGMLPSLVNANDGNAGWGISSLGFWGNTPLLGGGFVSQSGIGTWGAGLMLEKFSLFTDLSHTARFLYYQGTSDKNASRSTWLSGSNLTPYMNEKDRALEINLDSKYRIYRNLSATLDLAVVFMDWQSGVEKDYNVDSHMWRCGVGFQYSF